MAGVHPAKRPTFRVCTSDVASTHWEVLTVGRPGSLGYATEWIGDGVS